VVDTVSSTRLGKRFSDGLVYAAELHQHQVRKGSAIPYVGHLLSVAALVIEDGGDEDEAIAALLHDAVEDQGGRPTLEAIRLRFGERVASIVEGCSDAETLPKPPWHERKQRYILHLDDADASVLRVALADKLHNARAVLLDYRVIGDELWSRFNASREDTLWYYHAVLEVLRRRTRSPLVDELARTLEQLEDLVRAQILQH
jgi:GTP pyrophosphokinase